MGKFLLLLIFLLLLVLAGYAGYKSLPFIKSQLASTQITKLVSQTMPAVTSTPAVTPSPTPSLKLDTADSQTINSFLVASLGIKTHNLGRVYCAYKILNSGISRPRVIYLWAICQEYYSNQGNIIPGSGISVPLTLVVTWNNSGLQIISHRIPRAGVNYQSDLKDIFPSDMVVNQLLNPDRAMLSDLQNQINLYKSHSF